MVYYSSTSCTQKKHQGLPWLASTHSGEEIRPTSHLWQSNTAGRAHPARLELYWQKLAIREHFFYGFNIHLFLRVGLKCVRGDTRWTQRARPVVEHSRCRLSSRIDNRERTMRSGTQPIVCVLVAPWKRRRNTGCTRCRVPTIGGTFISGRQRRRSTAWRIIRCCIGAERIICSKFVLRSSPRVQRSIASLSNCFDFIRKTSRLL